MKFIIYWIKSPNFWIGKGFLSIDFLHTFEKHCQYEKVNKNKWLINNSYLRHRLRLHFTVYSSCHHNNIWFKKGIKTHSDMHAVNLWASIYICIVILFILYIQIYMNICLVISWACEYLFLIYLSILWHPNIFGYFSLNQPRGWISL